MGEDPAAHQPLGLQSDARARATLEAGLVAMRQLGELVPAAVAVVHLWSAGQGSGAELDQAMARLTRVLHTLQTELVAAADRVAP
jgi:hypothetical protein